MADRARRRRGFKLVEAVAATALLAVGVSASVGALAQLTRAEATMAERAELNRLAQTRLDEFLATSDLEATNLDGDFADLGRPDWTWTAEVLPTGVEFLEQVNFVATDRFGARVTLVTARYRPPVTSETLGAAAGLSRAASALGRPRR